MARSEYARRFVAGAEISAGVASIILALASGGIAPAVIFGALGLGAINHGRTLWQKEKKK